MQPRIEPELPPLPPGLEGLRGVELLRAAYEATRPGTSARTTPRPFAPPRPPGRPEKGTPEPQPTELPVAHWADDIPFPDEPPPEEEWR